MRHTYLLTTALGAVLFLGGGPAHADCLDHQAGDHSRLTLAQASGTNLGTPQMQPRPGGGVDAGPGAPTPALRGAPGSSLAEPRGAPSPGAGTAAPGGDATTGSNLAPSGAIRPGSQPEGGGTHGG